MDIPKELKYTKDHEWLKVAGDKVLVGITDFAQEQLGDVVYAELPEVGKVVKKGDTLAVVESVKAASDVYSPISGKVTKRNDNLAETPELLNASPYEKGWMVEIQPDSTTELEALLTPQQYIQLIQH